MFQKYSQSVLGLLGPFFDLGTFPKFCQYLLNSSRGDLFTHWLTHLSISKSSEHCNDYNDYNDYNAYQDYKNYKEYNN